MRKADDEDLWVNDAQVNPRLVSINLPFQTKLFDKQIAKYESQRLDHHFRRLAFCLGCRPPAIYRLVDVDRTILIALFDVSIQQLRSGRCILCQMLS